MTEIVEFDLKISLKIVAFQKLRFLTSKKLHKLTICIQIDFLLNFWMSSLVNDSLEIILNASQFCVIWVQFFGLLRGFSVAVSHKLHNAG